MYVQVRPPLLPVYLPTPSSVEVFQIIWVKCPRPLWYLCTLKLYRHTSSYLRTNQTNKHAFMNHETELTYLTNCTLSFDLRDAPGDATQIMYWIETKNWLHVSLRRSLSMEESFPGNTHYKISRQSQVNHLQLTITPSMYFWIKLNLRLHCYTFWWQLTENKAVIRGESRQDLYCSTYHDFTASWTLLASGTFAVVQPLARFSPSSGALECFSSPEQRNLLNSCSAYWSARSFNELLSVMAGASWMARRLLCCSRASRL